MVIRERQRHKSLFKNFTPRGPRDDPGMDGIVSMDEW